MNEPKKPRRLARRIRKGLALAAIFCALAILTLFASLWLEHRTALALPKPTGPFAVGRTLLDWVDDATLDTLAPSPGTKRELLVWIWYPASLDGAAAVDEYLPAGLRTEIESQQGVLLTHFLTRDLSKVHAHSLLNPQVSPQERSYPVVVMRAGASLEVVDYSTLAEDLASHGYVVVGFDAPYRTGIVVFPDGRVMKRMPENNPERCLKRAGADQMRCVERLLSAWTRDIGFVLDRLQQLNASDPSGKFTGRFDLTRVGVFGHSFGGAQAAQFCSQDSRCKAGIDIDGSLHGSVIQTGIHVPFMFLGSSQGDFSSDVEVREINADIELVYDRLPKDGRLRVTIRGANHFTFSDDGALLKSGMLRWVFRRLGKLGIDGPRQLEVTAYSVYSFFDAYLKGTGNIDVMKHSSPSYPELQVLE